MIIKQNGKCRIVTEKGKVLVEFGKDGTAEVADKLGARLLKLGYAAAEKSDVQTDEDQTVSLFDSEPENGGVFDDAGGETEAQASGSK